MTVASHAEAWIETRTSRSPTWRRRSPPTRRRGSKRWASGRLLVSRPSPPTRRRGSKPGGRSVRRCPCGSPPTRRRGSKLRINPPHPESHPVASHAEAWIETCPDRAGHRHRGVASHAEAWIETQYRPGQSPRWRVASHAEAWIETPSPAMSPRRQRWSPPTRRRGSKPYRPADQSCPGRRLPRGGVDRNT